MTDGPHRRLLRDLELVLTGSGVSADRAARVVGTIAETGDPGAVADLLLARAPQSACWFAVDDGFVYHTGDGLLLTPVESATLDYTLDECPYTVGGAAECRVGEQAGWLYKPLDDRVIRISSGTRVSTGQPLTDGLVDIAVLLKAFGPRKAEAAAAERLASLCALDAGDAELVVRPLLDAVEILDYVGDVTSVSPDLRSGALCTMERFQTEQGRAISRTLRELPPSADPRLHALAAVVDDAERVKSLREQHLSQVAEDAGRPITLALARPVYVGCTDLAVMIAQGGAKPAGNAAAAKPAIKSIENLPHRAEAEQRFLRHWGLELPDSIFRFQAFLASLDPVAAQALRDLDLCPWGVMDLLEAPEAQPRDGFDIRLHGRYYRDPPEFLTFMHGGSDGLHYGLWFDDGRTCDGVASYYNNDGDLIKRSARTPLEAVRATLERSWHEISEDTGQEGASDRLAALGVLRDAVTAFETWERPEVGRSYSRRYDFVRLDDSPLRTETLDGAGALVAGEAGEHDYAMFKDSAALRESVEEARRRCAAGDPAEALILGRDLHWASAGDPEREAYANELLVMAYQALDRPVLAEIAEIHHRHRDLPQVDLLGRPAV